MSIISQYVVVCTVRAMLGEIRVLYHGEAKPQVYVNTVTWWNIKPSSQGQKTHLSKQAFNRQSLALHEY